MKPSKTISPTRKRTNLVPPLDTPLDEIRQCSQPGGVVFYHPGGRVARSTEIRHNAFPAGSTRCITATMVVVNVQVWPLKPTRFAHTVHHKGRQVIPGKSEPGCPHRMFVAHAVLTRTVASTHAAGVSPLSTPGCATGVTNRRIMALTIASNIYRSVAPLEDTTNFRTGSVRSSRPEPLHVVGLTVPPSPRICLASRVRTLHPLPLVSPGLERTKLIPPTVLQLVRLAKTRILVFPKVPTATEPALKCIVFIHRPSVPHIPRMIEWDKNPF